MISPQKTFTDAFLVSPVCVLHTCLSALITAYHTVFVYTMDTLTK